MSDDTLKSPYADPYLAEQWLKAQASLGYKWLLRGGSREKWLQKKDQIETKPKEEDIN